MFLLLHVQVPKQQVLVISDDLDQVGPINFTPAAWVAGHFPNVCSTTAAGVPVALQPVMGLQAWLQVC
jgi:hypothetical protein